MTSSLPRTAPDGSRAAAEATPRSVPAGRPLALVAALGGAAAATVTLACCLLVALLAWFVTDAGAHGAPRDALQVGAVGWLVGHGSGIAVRGTAVTVLPLGLTLVLAWTTWRVARRVGGALRSYGPDADRVADGERDWTVPAATAMFTGGYVAVVLLTLSLATGPGGPGAGASTVGAVRGALMLGVLAGGAALAVGSGRAAGWLAALPPLARHALSTARAVLVGLLGAAALLLAVALLLDLGGVLEVFSRLGADAGDAVLLGLLTLLVVPNAVLFCAAWLLGPGFTVGAGTVVSPAVTVLGALPLLPLVPALPAEGTAPGAVALAVAAVPGAVAALAVARHQRAVPVRRWDEGLLRGGAGGVLAGVAVGLLAVLAGGALGPGRMAEVGPPAGEVLVHAVASLGLGGVLGGLLAAALPHCLSRRRAAGRAA